MGSESNARARVWQASTAANGTPGARNSRFTESPIVIDETPVRGGSAAGLAEISVTFSEAVKNVSASDLTVNGAPAKSVTGTGAGPYVFSVDPHPGGNGPRGTGWRGRIESGTGIGFSTDSWNYFDPLTMIVSIPDDAQGGPGAIVQVPISVAPGDGALGIDLWLEYDSTVLQAQGASVSGIAAAQGFGLVANTNPMENCTLPCRRIAIALFATGDPLVGSGEIATVQFLVVGSPGNTSDLTFTRVTVNEYQIPAAPDNGLFMVNCSGAANGTPCDDLDACTQTDTCQGGVCTGSNPRVCTPQDQCHVGVCNPVDARCSQLAQPNGTPCEDGNPCTLSDTCSGGISKG